MPQFNDMESRSVSELVNTVDLVYIHAVPDFHLKKHEVQGHEGVTYGDELQLFLVKMVDWRGERDVIF